MTYILYTLFIYPITQIIELCFTFSLKIFKDAGISILGISVIISLLCLPLYNAAEKWQKLERDTVKRLKIKLENIKSAFSGDERFMIVQAFYRQNNYHPVYALRSTFGILLQIPFFIAAYSFLSHLEIIKGVSFLFITNLGAPDALLSVGNIKINILPILMTLINIISGIIYAKDFPIKDKLQLYVISALFLVLLYNSPSALVIYWTTNNIFSLLKNIYNKINIINKYLYLTILIFCFFIYIIIHLLYFYNGNWFLRVLITGLIIAIISIHLLYFINKRFIKLNLNIIISKFMPTNSLFLFISSFTALWVLSGIFIPANLIVSSSQEFSFLDNYTSPLFFVFNTFLQAAGIFLIWPLFIYFLFPESKNIFSVLGAVLLVCSLINFFFFQGNYGLISVELIFDKHVYHTFKESGKNIFILFIPILLLFLFFRFKKENIISAIFIICTVSTLAISTYNFTKINNEYLKLNELRNEDSWSINEVKPIFDLSQKGKNTVIIILDRAVSLFIPYIFEEDPSLNEIYSGFIFYPNTVSFNHYTVLGMPPIYGGYEYTPLGFNKRDDINMVTKHNEALLLMPTIFSNADYNVTVVDPPYPNYSFKEDLQIYNSIPNTNALLLDSRYTRLWLDEHDINFSSLSDILKRNLLWYSIFKISPLALRYGIYLQGDYCSPSLMNKMMLTLNGYAILDYLIYFSNIKDDNKNNFLIMVNNTTHEPSFLQAPDYRPASVISNHGTSPFNKETAYHVNIASIKRLGDWFNFLKANNVYDNTRIILVSDHGAAPVFKYKTNLPFNIEWYNALLLVKDFNATGNFKTDNSFMSNGDVPFLALNNQIENPINPFTGNEISTSCKLNPLYITMSTSFSLSSPDSKTINLNPNLDYYVHTNLFNQDNWKRAHQ